MIGRGRVISLTPSGSPRCGTGVERFTSSSALPKSSLNHGNPGTKTEVSHWTFCIAKRSIVKAERRTRMKVKLQIEG